MIETVNIDKQTGLLDFASYCPSPHYDERPTDAVIDMIVIHGISLPKGIFGGDIVQDFFCGTLDMTLDSSFASIANLKVSSHLFIKRTGEIIQFVPFTKRAWHAGESFFQGKTRCNDFSIGIELEGTDTIPYEAEQYHQLIRIIRLLMQTYQAVTKDRIVGHSEIAPGRKTDPGPVFNWAYLKGNLA